MLCDRRLVGGLFSTTPQSRVHREPGRRSHLGRLLVVHRKGELTLPALLFGNVYERFAPLNFAAALASRPRARRRDVHPFRLSGPVGAKMAAVALLSCGRGWSWFGRRRRARPLARILVAYWFATLIGFASTRETWLGNVSSSVFSLTHFSRFFAARVRPFVPIEWAVSEQRTAALKTCGAGLRNRPCGPGRGAHRACGARQVVSTAGRRPNRFGVSQEWFLERWSSSHHCGPVKDANSISRRVLFLGAYLPLTLRPPARLR